MEDSMKRLTAGVVIGVGLGGFADGIVLHQIAQWHNMGSAVLPPVTMEAMSRNMTWDGLFHLATWTITLIGVCMLWNAGRLGVTPVPATTFAGQLVFGWGLFNLVEGVVDHHILKLHHVRDLPVYLPVYDYIFLTAGGVGLLLIGWLLMQLGRQRNTAARNVPPAADRLTKKS
jgi:uncharacterized membrane protein